MENNNMPMPNKKDSDVSANISSPLSGDAGSSESVSSESSLNTPSHDEGKPILESSAGKIDNELKVPVSPSRGIEVVATRKGFYNQHRKRAGDEFKVAKFEELGEWMQCKDKALEKKRVEFFENKKKKAKK